MLKAVLMLVFCTGWQHRHINWKYEGFDDLDMIVNGIHSIRFMAREDNVTEADFGSTKFGMGSGRAKVVGRNFNEKTFFMFINHFAQTTGLWLPTFTKRAWILSPCIAVFVEGCSDFNGDVPVGGLSFDSPVTKEQFRWLKKLAQGAQTVGNKPMMIPVMTGKTHKLKGDIINDYKMERLY